MKRKHIFRGKVIMNCRKVFPLQVTLKCCKRKKLFLTNEIRQILNLCKAFIDGEIFTEHRLQKAFSTSLFDEFTYWQIGTQIAYERFKTSKCQR